MWMSHRLLNKYLFLFNVGGLLYILIELIWRGRSHWTMFLLGGICFVFLGLINEVLPWQMPLWQQILIGAVGITTLEFLTGCIVIWLSAGTSGTTAGFRATSWGRSVRSTLCCGCQWHWSGLSWMIGSGIGNSGRNGHTTD